MSEASNKVGLAWLDYVGIHVVYVNSSSEQGGNDAKNDTK